MALSSTLAFLALPDEVLLYQLAFFHSLTCHLAFSATCRRIYAIYDDSLWRRIALSCGLGRPLDLALRQVPWRTICASAVRHSISCRLLDCSERELAKGRNRGLFEAPCNLVLNPARVASEQSELCLSFVFEGMLGDLGDLHSVTIPCRAKRRHLLSSWFSRLFQKPDFLSSISQRDLTMDGGMITKMAHHLPASCALATVPAVDCLVLDIGPETVQVRNSDGVCVWDVINVLARKLLEAVPLEPGHEDMRKEYPRVYQLIAQEWRQYVLLKFSLHGRGSVNVHVDVGEEIIEDYIGSMSA